MTYTMSNVPLPRYVDLKLDCGFKAVFERCVYYGSGLFRMNLERGGIYTSLQPVYVVGILNYKLKHGPSTNSGAARGTAFRQAQ